MASSATLRRIVDLEWPTRYVLECGHGVAIAADADVADMCLPGQELACAICSGELAEPPKAWLAPFKPGEPINAGTLNARFEAIEARLRGLGHDGAIALFAPDEPINADTLNARLSTIDALLAGG